MGQQNYQAMSEKELRAHFLRHKNDREALSAYLSRINAKGRKVIAKVGDPDFDEKIHANILQQMQASNTKANS